jgi:hypothetical protein
MRTGWLAMAVGCGAAGNAGKDPIQGDGTSPECAAGATYPQGATEPMALGETMTPYRWPVAVDRRSGARVPLDLGDAPCDLDAELGWGQYDALLFVSIPAW